MSRNWHFLFANKRKGGLYVKVKKLLIVGTSLLMLLAQGKVNAYTEYPLKEESTSFTKSIEAKLLEEDEVI